MKPSPPVAKIDALAVENRAQGWRVAIGCAKAPPFCGAFLFPIVFLCEVRRSVAACVRRVPFATMAEHSTKSFQSGL